MSEAIGIVERLNDLRLAAFRAGGFDTPAAKAYYRALSTAFQRDELVDAAEISRLTARIAELEKALRLAEKALKPFANRVYNDNGDMTISDMYRLTADNCIAAYFAHKRARTTLEASEREK